jgi:hypothetical protein
MSCGDHAHIVLKEKTSDFVDYFVIKQSGIKRPDLNSDNSEHSWRRNGKVKRGGRTGVFVCVCVLLLLL